ncbi:hypothetical protein HanXRQr2_Chr05g0213051 [Helianthus annuus]|uniref:Uncharacterized protein n=1 Tax=Helianthus annuus TaxID=4232 RepID=A0A9K3IZQ4_HELAN|nr:hypothetical protein HanXRQr2_Chr05g0213051 [Helianthus annuus]
MFPGLVLLMIFVLCFRSMAPLLIVSILTYNVETQMDKSFVNTLE